MLLYYAKQLKNGEDLNVVLSPRPVNLSYAPFYDDEVMSKFNPKDFIFPINNKKREKELKNKYTYFKEWFNIDEINYDDTKLIFDINIIRLNKFLKKEGINNLKINFYKSMKNIPNIGMRHHFHKIEWSYDLDESNLNIVFKDIIDKWKKDKIPISKKYRNEIVKILDKYKSLNKEHIINVHDFKELNKKYNTFLVGGPFTSVKEIIKKGVKVDNIIAMSSSIYTGTTKYNKNSKYKPNIFPEQFNNYVDIDAAAYVLSQDIKTILIPTEPTKPYKEKNNYALTFSSKDITSWGKNISSLFKEYNGNNSLNDDKNQKMIIECKDNKDIIDPDLIKDEIWKGNNKYIIVGNLDIENYEDKRLLHIKPVFINEVNNCFKK